MLGQRSIQDYSDNDAADHYSTVVKQVESITGKEREQIANLYLKYYEASSVERVQNDLKGKSEIILLYHANEIVGFTTLEFYFHQWNGQQIGVVFSGDTVIEKQHWGRQMLAFTCISRMGRYKRLHSDIPFYWFLIVKGHRTYKYLPVFAKKFYPHWEYESPSLKMLMESLVIEKFGNEYNRETGVLEFEESRGHLKQAYAYPGHREIDKPSVKYFLKRNPGFIKGHELVCLCELSAENLKPLTRRIFEKGTL